MDFMRLLKSIEELLYEVVTWILFYPITLWRILSHPLRMLAYAEKELTDAIDQQYDDALSPPILLLFTLVLVYLAAGAIAPAANVVLPGMLADSRNLIVYRAVAFSLFPLMFAVTRLRLRGTRLTRQLLRPAFYAQCYAAAPFIITFSLGLDLIAYRGLALPGAIVLVVGIVWYLAVETRWLAADSDISLPRAVLATVGTFVVSIVLLIGLSLLTNLAVVETAPAA